VEFSATNFSLKGEKNMDEVFSNKRRPEMNEIDLIRRARLEDISAYEDLVQRYYSRIYGLIYGMTSHREDAEAVTQEVFIRAWKGIDHFRDQASFYTWIYRIAINRSRHFRKKRAHRKTPLFEEFDPEVKQSDVYKAYSCKGSLLRKMSLSEFQKKLNGSLLKLSEKDRAVLVMHDVQAMSSADIAGVLGGAEELIHSRVLDAQHHLSRGLGDLGEDLDISSVLSLKMFEHPSETQIQKMVQVAMTEVRAAHKRPSLLLFPDKSMGWMLAQPRYGVVALFLLFLGLHTCGRPVPESEHVVDDVIPQPELTDVLRTNAVSPLEIPAVHPDLLLESPEPASFSSQP
jgi:RNA polymerase sigma factor (sigma-70 family)